MARHQQQRRIDLPGANELETMICGDALKSARLTNQWGQRLGKALAKPLAASQIRNIFGKVRQIEMNWTADEDEVASRRDLILLQPKLKYQAERKPEVKDLAELLTDAIELVDRQGDALPARDKFQRFVDLFEAILAYHKAEGGK